MTTQQPPIPSKYLKFSSLALSFTKLVSTSSHKTISLPILCILRNPSKEEGVHSLKNHCKFFVDLGPKMRRKPNSVPPFRGIWYDKMITLFFTDHVLKKVNFRRYGTL
ncbi:hypothetical protein ACOSQ3_015235 [Xanthoceras sorbifolium]